MRRSGERRVRAVRLLVAALAFAASIHAAPPRLVTRHMPARAAADDDQDLPIGPLPTVAGTRAIATSVPPVRDGLPLKAGRLARFTTDEGTWLSPDLSPDGRRIVFELLGDLYGLPVEGGQARPIATGMAFDSQPAFAPDGRLAFLSDRSGAENVWAAAADGAAPRQVTHFTDDPILTSPAWSADGRTIYVSRYRPEYTSFELLRVDAASGVVRVLIPIGGPDTPADARSSAVGAAPSRDGHWLYYAAEVGSRDADPPGWVIRRRDLATGSDETVVEPPRSYRPDLVLGTYFRPMPSPDGRLLVYATRYGSQMWLRVLDLRTHADRWLARLDQHDELDALASRDFAPHYAFTPDGRKLVVNDGGKLRLIALADGAKRDIPFQADVRLPLGPAFDRTAREATGPVRARLIQHPLQSPDGTRLVFSALGQVYVMALDGRGSPRRLTSDPFGEFEPSWSPDGRTIVYTRWTARDGGQLWRVAADGSGAPVQLTDVAAFYTAPVFTPDGRSIVAIRSSNDVRMHRYMEYGPLRDAELVVLPSDRRAPARVVARGTMGGLPHFGPDPSRVNLLFDDGLNAVALDSGERRLLVQVTGPGYYFQPGRAPVDDLRLSPDGTRLLVQSTQQLYLLGMPATAGTTLDLARPPVPHRKLTDVGADFLQWSADGRTIGWGLGATWFRRALADIALDPPGTTARDAVAGPPKHFAARVEVPRDVPHGAMLLRGATAITMRGGEVLHDAEILVRDGRIATLGPRGSVAMPPGAVVRDVAGKWIVPGFIDDHDHVADIRRVVLDAQSWGPAANLAYGITTAFDPSTLSIDMLAYQDMIDAGLMIGSRIRSTGPALFSFNEFTSKAQVDRVLDRYRDYYRLDNVKLYRTGNRQVREWIAASARAHGLLVTTEGATTDKLDLTQIQDGIPGSEHALPAAPLYRDVQQLIAQSGVTYNLTLMINGGGQDYFIVARQPNGDPKLNRFAPRYIVDMKTRKRPWKELADALFPAYAAAAASIVRAGGTIGMGSHGEIPGLGFHWEMEAHVMGGMTPAETLTAATLGSARAIGREADLGSIAPGKIADLVILDADPLADIRNTLRIDAVMQGGRLYASDTLDQLWPTPAPFPIPWYRDDRPPGTPDPGLPLPHRSNGGIDLPWTFRE